MQHRNTSNQRKHSGSKKANSFKDFDFTKHKIQHLEIVNTITIENLKQSFTVSVQPLNIF